MFKQFSPNMLEFEPKHEALFAGLLEGSKLEPLVTDKSLKFGWGIFGAKKYKNPKFSFFLFKKIFDLFSTDTKLPNCSIL